MGKYQDGLERTFDPDEDIQVTAEEKDAEDTSIWEGAVAGFQQDELDLGIDVDQDTRKHIFSKYADHAENEVAYNAYADVRKWYNADTFDHAMRAQVDRGVENGRWSLVDGKVVDSDTSWLNDSFMYDNDVIKGALLAKAQGYNKDVFDVGYKEYTALKNKEFSNITQNAPVGAIVGMLGSYVYSPEGAFGILGSPTKIVGKTMMKMAGKRAGSEMLLAMGGGMSREAKKQRHAAKADLNYGLADSAENILLEVGVAGILGVTGSMILDGITWAKVKSRLKADGKWGNIDATDSEILERFFRREENKLTRSSVKHEDLMLKTEMDIDDGNLAAVADELDIPIESKLPDDVETNSLPDEMSIIRAESGIDEDMAVAEKAIDDTPDYTDTSIESKYEGMVDDQLGDDTLEAMRKVDPEIDEQLKQLEADEATLKAERDAYVEPEEIDTGSKEFGDMMEEGDAPNPQGFQSKTMNINGVDIPKTEYDLIQKYQKNRKFNRENPHKKRKIPKAQEDAYTKHSDVADDIEDIEFKSGGTYSVFAKFGDNLAAGTVAGVETDEDGNISFDPAKFVAGMGGYTVLKALVKNPKMQKEFKDYAERALESFESKQGSQLVTGKQSIVEQTKNTKKTIYHGTSEIFNEFDTSKSADGSIWFTDKKSRIEEGEVGASSKGVIMERVINENNLKLGGWDEQDKFSTDELIREGFDGLRLEEDGEVTYKIFNPEKLEKTTHKQSIIEQPKVAQADTPQPKEKPKV